MDYNKDCGYLQHSNMSHTQGKNASYTVKNITISTQIEDGGHEAMKNERTHFFLDIVRFFPTYINYFGLKNDEEIIRDGYFCLVI